MGDSEQNWAFLTIDGVVAAVAVPAGQATIMLCGKVHPARQPETDDEIEAVWAAKRNRCLMLEGQNGAAALTADDFIGAMAGTIVAAARDRGAVSRDDFHRAGIPDSRIDSNLDAAYAAARQMEPRIDAILARDVAA
jgi:hypothetical protein